MFQDEKMKEFLEKHGVVVPRSALAEAYGQVLRLSGIGLTGLISSAVERSAAKVAEEYRNLYGTPEPEDLPDIVAAFLREGHWGEFDVASRDEKGFTLRAPSTLFSETTASKKPVCHPITASIQGFIRAITGGKVHVKEVSCRARGDDACLFEVRMS